MKGAGIIVFTVKLLEALYAGYTNVDEKKIARRKEPVIPKDVGDKAYRRPYVGIGLTIIAGALLILSRKKSSTGISPRNGKGFS